MGMIPEASRTKCLTAAVTIFGMTATDLSCAYGTTSKRRTETIFDDAGHLGVILASNSPLCSPRNWAEEQSQEHKSKSPQTIYRIIVPASQRVGCA